MLAWIPIILKLLGFAEKAYEWEQEREAKKKAQFIADAPKTKEERTDAANNGTL